MESGKNSLLILWVGVAAAATGILAVAAISHLRGRSLAHSDSTHRLRGVQEVLADCYSKIREIEEHLPELDIAPPARRHVQPLSNGKPVLGS